MPGSADSGSCHFSFLQGKQAKQTGAVRCTLFCVHNCHSLFIKSKETVCLWGDCEFYHLAIYDAQEVFLVQVVGGGAKGHGWLAGAGGICRRAVEASKCWGERWGVGAPAKHPWVCASVLLCMLVCFGPVQRHPLRKLKAPVLTEATWKRGGDPFVPLSTQFLLLNDCQSCIGWFYRIFSFHTWTLPPEAEVQQCLLMQAMTQFSPEGKVQPEPCSALLNELPALFFHRLRRNESSG